VHLLGCIIHITVICHRRESRRNNGLISAADVESMLLGTPANSINRKIDVRKENEDVAVESLLDNIIDGPDGPQSLFNVDVMSEAMDVAFVDGRVRVVSTVRCDRTTKIPGYDYVRHRSSVIVTKTTDIDMMHSEDRRRLYERLQHASLLATQQSPHQAAADDLDNDRNGLGDLEIDPRDEEKFVDAESLNIYRALRQLADVYNKNVLGKQMASHTKGENTSRHRVVNSDDEYDTDVIEKQLDDYMTRASRCVLPQSPSDVSSYVDTATNQLDILY
jgi:alkylated DNA nucleotide flippase Atl1